MRGFRYLLRICISSREICTSCRTERPKAGSSPIDLVCSTRGFEDI